jgi:hypothetical protein
MAAVRRGVYHEPGRITDHSNIRPPTDATQSRPYLFLNNTTQGFGDLGYIGAAAHRGVGLTAALAA